MAIKCSDDFKKVCIEKLQEGEDVLIEYLRSLGFSEKEIEEYVRFFKRLVESKKILPDVTPIRSDDPTPSL